MIRLFQPAAGENFSVFHASKTIFPLFFSDFFEKISKKSQHFFELTKNIFGETKQFENSFVSNEKKH